MAKKKFYDPYAELIDRFNRKGVSYVVVGMSGINYYARDARGTFSTQDFDIFVNPTIPNIKKAVSILKELGYSVMVNGQEAQEERIKDAVRRKNTIIATDAYGVMFELILAVSGYTFNQMELDAVIFDVSSVPIKVARLNKLLMSKKAAARDKDKIFLKRFRALLKETR
jgi:predicted nucleotidyltransferase